jgi:hypothetical protein
MATTSLERGLFARARVAHLRSRTLRRAALLLGTAFFLQAAPAWAANECGVVPPGGGTVTCPAGEYPNGIHYFTFVPTEIRLEPGFVARGDSSLEGADFRLIGPVNTLFAPLPGQGAGSPIPVSLFVFVLGPVYIDIDDVHPTEQGDGALNVLGSRSITIRADSVTSSGAPAVSVTEVVSSFFPSSAPITGVGIRINSVMTTGNDSFGIRAGSDQGDVIIDGGTVSTGGNRSPAINVTRGSNVAINAGTVATTGVNSPGITTNARGDTMIVTQLVETSGAGSSNGITALGNGKVDITSGVVRVKAHTVANTDSRGIVATSLRNDVTINSGSVMTEPDRSTAIQAASPSGHVRIVTGSIETNGSESRGISVEIVGGGAVTISSGTVTTRGADAPAIGVRIDGPVSVTSGTITTSGARSPGIMATSFASTVTVNSGTVQSGGIDSPGIWASSNRTVEVTAANVHASGLRSDAIRVNAAISSTVTIGGLVRAQDGFALRAEGGPATATILAGGTLRGRISLTGGADRINNNGTFDAIGASQFGAGADLFENNAGGTVRSINGGATFASLEMFNNRGTIEMRDAAANDSLTLPGAYAGAAGARLGLDVDFASGTADRLVTGAATGATLIDIGGSGGDFTSGILLVDAGTGTSPTAFSLAPGGDTAYLRRDLRFDAANNDFLLVQGPGTAVFETARFGSMASRLWYESADAVAAQLDTVRDGRRGRGVALWLQGWSGEGEHSGTQTLAGVGAFDVSYEQDFQGLQGGLDFQSGPVLFGITGGAGRSDATFVTGNPVDMQVKNVGLYLQGRAGPFFYNALAKQDWAELEIDPGPGLGAEFEADLFGLQANAGLRLDFGAVYAEPSIGLSWVLADLDSFESGPATVEPGDIDSLRARAGLRVGARLPLGGGDLLPYVAVNVYEELGDGNESEFTLGETLRLFDEPAGTRGQAAAGLSFVTPGFEAFVRGEMDFGGGADARAVRAGARLRF